MYCFRCGNKLKDDSVFCSECGLKVAEMIGQDAGNGRISVDEKKKENEKERDKSGGLIKEENNVPGTKIEEIGKHDEQIKYLHKELISLQVKYQQQVKRQEKMERVVLDVVKALQSISEENQ